MKDPIVEEVRTYRMEHTRKFQGNLSAICADLRNLQSTSPLKRGEILQPSPLEGEGEGEGALLMNSLVRSDFSCPR
jgi:hypothetical protein